MHIKLYDHYLTYRRSWPREMIYQGSAKSGISKTMVDTSPYQPHDKSQL